MVLSQVGHLAFAVAGVLVATGCETGTGGESGAIAEPSAEAHVSLRWVAGGMEEIGGVVLESPVLDAAIGPEGIVAVPVPRRHVLLVAPAGTRHAVVGRQGQGPGEFQDPRAVGFLGDSLLWVTDGALGRISFFTLDGTFVESWSRPWEQVPGSPWSVRGQWVLSDGSVLGLPSGPDDPPSGDLLPFPVAVWDPDGSLETVAWIDRVAPLGRRIPTTRGLPVSGPQPIQATPLLGVPRNGEWAFVLDRPPAEAETGVIHIRRFALGDTTAEEIQIPYRSVPVGTDILESIRTMAQAWEEGLPPEAGRIRAEDVLAATWIPERLPPVQQALADEEGFWLRREQFKEPGMWERYDLKGRLIARFRLPDAFSGLAGSPAGVVGVTVDDMGVPELRYYGIDLLDPSPGAR